MRGIRLLRRVGPHPVGLATEVAHRITADPRQAALRRRYHARVVAVAHGAALVPPRIALGTYEELPSPLREPAERVRDEAQDVLRHRVDFLGSGRVDLGAPIDWHRDPKSGYRWPEVFYQDVEVTRLDDDSDAKLPWELSRGHQLLTLARAARLFREERFAGALEQQLGHWIEANPPGLGINWVNAMEVAIRAVDWVWAIGTLEDLRPLDPALRARVTRSLQAHGRHVAANLEGSPALRSNHYLADVLGLLVLGLCLRGDTAAGRWRRFARRRLEREILRQVLPDGVGFEASLPYHGLALEMFLLAWHLCAVAGEPLSQAYRARLELMLEVSRAVRHADGRTPVFGDQDSGRILPAGFARPATHDPLLSLGAAILVRPRPVAAEPDEEVAWTLGVGAWRALAARPVDARPTTRSFPCGGIYVLTGPGARLVARWGGVGQNGMGGHAHNDLGSFELSYGSTLVVDPGSYVYTADPRARDAFRAARAHNVLVVDGRDMHPIPPGRPFELPEHARHRVERFDDGGERPTLVGSHDGYGRRVPLTVRRTITLHRATGAVEVRDDVEGTPHARTLESFVHLAPGTIVERDGDAALRLALGPVRARIVFEGAQRVDVDAGWVSNAYGTRERAPVVRATAEATPPARLRYRVVPEEVER
jgi:Heparinase II/III-like protein/Heparinase II/III N-terminus